MVESTEHVVPDARDDFDYMTRAARELTSSIHTVVVGQDEVIQQLLITIFCGGHAVLVGVPGLAKTMLISTISKSMDLSFSRIQFTPDLMPADITGTEVIEEDKSTGSRAMRFVPGPVFANIILADEINRTPPKTQAALLESMQEKQVTSGGIGYPLPDPFFVLATQNPIEQEGTYPLPEAQLDRFMFSILIHYPSEEQELLVVQEKMVGDQVVIEPVLNREDLQRIQGVVRSIPIADHVARYALAMARSTRPSGDDTGLDIVRDYVSWGAGPRASQYLVLAAKAKAALDGDRHVTPAHIQEVAHPVLRHRIITNFNADADGITPETIINTLIEEIPVDLSDKESMRRLDAVMD